MTWQILLVLHWTQKFYVLLFLDFANYRATYLNESLRALLVIKKAVQEFVIFNDKIL